MAVSTYISIHTLFQYFEVALVVFLTLMTSKYLLGEKIEPDNKLYRIIFVSALWCIAIPASVVIVFIKRHVELRKLRKQNFL